LAETRRVLKPGGMLRFVEHVRAEGAFGTLLDLVTPAWKRLCGGCHPNRRTGDDIVRAGFALERVEHGRLPPGVPLLAGVARTQRAHAGQALGADRTAARARTRSGAVTGQAQGPWQLRDPIGHGTWPYGTALAGRASHG
jgi:hypothetical protein